MILREVASKWGVGGGSINTGFPKKDETLRDDCTVFV